MNNKEFDAVRMMREIRDKLSKRYARNPEAEKRDLEDIRRKYGKQNRSSSLGALYQSKIGEKDPDVTIINHENSRLTSCRVFLWALVLVGVLPLSASRSPFRRVWRGNTASWKTRTREHTSREKTQTQKLNEKNNTCYNRRIPRNCFKHVVR